MKTKLEHKFLNISLAKYFNKLNIKGQTSIELIVLIFIVSTIIFSASAIFFPRVEGLLNNQKVAWINRIAKTGKVYRSDFEPISISIGEDTGGVATGERAKERQRRQEAARKRRGEEGIGASATSSPQTADGLKPGGTSAQDEEAERLRRQRAAEQESILREQERQARRQRIESLDVNDPIQKQERDRLEKQDLEDLSVEEQERLRLSRRFEPIEERKTSIFSSKHSSFWKFIIILVIVVFFIIIFFKSKSKKD